ncbi:MAG: hypothetical protein JNN29_09015 [Chitinophagaceae bacterium]|nr:hypothetical protein [Chitinophagaceae bacterium]MBN8668119.1 hypothetical protein [Chitinophagales bacterium]
MRFLKWAGALAAVLLVISCFLPWITIPFRNIQLTGVDTTGTNFGKPGYFHFLNAAFFLLLNFIPRIWAKRWNLLVIGLNTGWALRNFLLIPACSGGICPDREIGLYLMAFSSLAMLVAGLFPQMKLPGETNS